MVELTELVERVRSECAAVLGTEGVDPAFGIPEGESSWDVYGHSHLQSHYSKFEGLFLPKPMQMVVRDLNNFSTKFNLRNDLYIFHYSLRNLKGSIEKQEETRRFLWEHHSHKPVKERREITPEPASVEARLARYYDKFGGSISAIFTTVRGESSIIGNKDIMQEVMDSMKESPYLVCDFLKQLSDNRTWQAELDCIKTVYLYDVLERPRKVIYNG